MHSTKESVFHGLIHMKKTKNTPRRENGWYPPALRWWSSLIASVVCWTSIAVLQYHLHKSQTEGGIIFAANINSLPLSKSFWFLYLPTIVAVIFSIFLVWIDHDAKRFEPYRQMAKVNGASGKDSMLLHYPFDFMPTVPFVALKRRHWLVFWASTGSVLTTFGVVPFQAGIFATDNVTRNTISPFKVSQAFKHQNSQNSASIIDSARSAYGILKLNETVPNYMTLNYTLAPFTTVSPPADYENGLWTANTTLYGMDLKCEQPKIHANKTSEWGPDFTWFQISPDCEIFLRNINNDTIGDELDVWSYGVGTKAPRFQTYTSFFLPYGGLAPNDLGTQKYCYEETKGLFLTTFVRNKASQTDIANNITAISCMPFYYEQSVEATIDIKSKAPVSVTPHSSKQTLSPAMFNATIFESALALGQGSGRDNALPGVNIPNYQEGLRNRNLTTFQSWADKRDLPPMTVMALTLTDRPTGDYLDPRVLEEAYATAYKLLFARAMNSILETNFSLETNEVLGQRVVHSEAVTLEPVFTYIVEVFLALVSIAMSALFYYAIFRHKASRLNDDPGSIAAVMSMVADSSVLLTHFETLDCCSKKELLEKVESGRFIFDDTNTTSCNLTLASSPTLQQHPSSHASNQYDKEASQVGEPSRPSELRFYTGIPLVSLFIALLTILAVFFAKSRESGLPLPSKSRFVQNLVSGYLPTAIATLIEPMWILLNRLLCILQPFEELRTLKARPAKSLTLNYASLPPPLTLFKAAHAGHLLLATVCAMALLANLLATTFAGLLFQDDFAISHPTSFKLPLQHQFLAINGSSGPPTSGRPIDSGAEFSGAYQGSSGEEQFLVSDSNYSRKTNLPAWVDETAMYLPFDLSQDTSKGHEYQARTKYFSAFPNCRALTFEEDYRMILWNSDNLNYTDPGRNIYNNNYEAPESILEISVTGEKGDRITCYRPQWDNIGSWLEVDFAYSLGFRSRFEENCSPDSTAAELQTPLAARVNATEYEQRTCQSAVALAWMRRGKSQCMDSFSASPKYDNFEEANGENTFLITCQPKLSVGDANVRVNSDGLLQEKATGHVPDPDQSLEGLSRYAPNGAADLISQANLFFFRSQSSGWHNDSFANEYLHYFINKAMGDNHLTQPGTPLPKLTDIEEPLNKAYARMFAIWLGINKELLLTPASDSTPGIEGTVLIREERLFFNVPLFIISEIILGVYIVVLILVYLWRPGRYLPHLPQSIAAIVAVFASSAAVKDLKGTSDMKNKEREKFLTDLDYRYGYGSFVGSDGAVHVGIEKVPYVTYMKEVTFKGSRIERELRKRKENQDGEKAMTRTEYVVLPLDDAEDGNMGRPPTPRAGA